MGNYEIALPYWAYEVKPRIYPISRDGIDGREKILQVFGGDNFVGEVLSGTWSKILDTGLMVGSPRIYLDGGSVKFVGKSDIAGTARSITMVDYEKFIVFVDDTVVDVHFNLNSLAAAPTTDQHSLFLYFVDNTWSNYWWVSIICNDTTVWVDVAKYADGVTTYFAQTIILSNLECTFRIKWKQQSQGYTHVYCHDGSGDVDEDEDELDDSPFNLGLETNLFLPWYRFHNSATTSQTVESEFIRVTYPDNPLHFGYYSEDNGRLLCRCKVFDTNNSDTESEWTEVFDAEHTFIGDRVLQNGLIRYKIINGQYFGIIPYFYTGVLWKREYSFILFEINGVGNMAYPYLTKLLLVTPEKVVAEVIFFLTEQENYDNYVRAELTLRRGSYTIELFPTQVFPVGSFQFIYYNYERFGFSGDAETHDIGDDYLAQSSTNTTMSKNYILKFTPT